MAKITYVEFNGTKHVIDVQPGMTVMEGAVKNNVPGIDAECGGACACATCHVYIAASGLAKLEPRDEMEEGMLESAWEPRDNSRLSCQIHIAAGLDGLEVTVPRQQGSSAQ